MLTKIVHHYKITWRDLKNQTTDLPCSQQLRFIFRKKLEEMLLITDFGTREK